MANKVGNLIKKARKEAGLTQDQLSRKVKGASASDIGKAERGEIRLTNDQLKQIAKATGVTQKSLLDAAASSSYKNSTSSGSSSSASSSSGTTSKGSMKVSTTERRLVELYRKADSDTKKKVMDMLKKSETVDAISEGLGSLIESAIGMLTK
ncbi:MAG: helix-turn-helix transcriptional regulator [Parasporobacterium sp.]|nr:helix-turn-helix transcriptional regulator [Parasporobacterium sp.]